MNGTWRAFWAEEAVMGKMRQNVVRLRINSSGGPENREVAWGRHI